MKKTYIKPAMEACEIDQMSSLLAGSMDLPGTTDITDGNLSRDFDPDADW